MGLNYLLVIALLLLALCVPRQGAHLLRFLEKPLGPLGRRPIFSAVLIGGLAFTISAALSVAGPMPVPRIHDEFSNLLLADTLAHGRLSNPTHPLWVHFESHHIIHQPTYASKYPVAPGLMMAMGQVLSGRPIVGVWLSGALASGAVYWMLRAWLRPRWAVLGGLLAVVHPTMLLWSQGYWGGAVAVLGGALLLGSARRLANNLRCRYAVLMGLGLSILANSRPFEGAVLTILTMVILVPTILRHKMSGCTLLGRFFVPIGLVMVPTALAMGYYNYRVTGNPLRLPYQVHQDTYSMLPLFLWQTPKPELTYRHKEIRDFEVGWHLPIYEAQRSVAGLLRATQDKVGILFHGALPLPALQLALLGLPGLLRNRWLRRGLWLTGGFLFLLLELTGMRADYAAPIAGLVFAFLVQGLCQVRVWKWRGPPTGRFLVRATLVLILLAPIPFGMDLQRYLGHGWHVNRAQLLGELTRQGGHHLIIVRYGPNHSPHEEWVYNEAEIDAAKVVWAREMEPEQNHKLVDYFKDRSIWLLEPDKDMVLRPVTSDERL